MTDEVPRRWRLIGFAMIVAASLSACGGGGSGGTGSGGSSMSASPASLSVTTAVNGAAPGSAQVTLNNVPSNANHVAWQNSSNGIGSVTVDPAVNNAAIVSIVYKPPGSLSPGTYTDQVEVKFCSSSPCTNAIAGADVTIPISYTVTAYTAATTPTVTFSQTQLSYQGLKLDIYPPPPLVDSISMTNFGVVPYFSVSGVGNVVVNAQAYAGNPSAGTLTVSLTPPINMSTGLTTVSLQITACLDENCVNPVPGSPFSISVNYTVGDTISVAGPQGYTIGVTTFNIRTMLWDVIHGQIIVQTPLDALNVAHVANLDPTTWTLGPLTPLNSNTTGALALSDDGQYLYVGLDNGTIQRFTLPGFVADIVIPVDHDAQGQQLYAVDIEVAPGAPHTIAVAEEYAPFRNGGSLAEASVAIFDDAVPRAQRASGTVNPNVGTLVDYLTWGGDAQTLYGTGRALPGVFTMAIDSQGVASSVNWGTFAGTMPHWAAGLLYLDGGQIVNPGTGSVVQQFTGFANPYGLLPDSVSGRLFVSNSDVGPSAPPHIFSLDLSSYSAISDIQMPGIFAQQEQWLLLRGGGLPAPTIVISAPGPYLGYITGGFIGP